MNNQTNEEMSQAYNTLAKLFDGWTLDDAMGVLVVLITAIWEKEG